MYLIYGQFWNQTLLRWDWQQIGGTATNDKDAKDFAYGFAVNYHVPCKVIHRTGVTLYLPPVNAFGGENHWPLIPEQHEVIITH